MDNPYRKFDQRRRNAEQVRRKTFRSIISASRKTFKRVFNKLMHNHILPKTCPRNTKKANYVCKHKMFNGIYTGHINEFGEAHGKGYIEYFDNTMDSDTIYCYSGEMKNGFRDGYGTYTIYKIVNNNKFIAYRYEGYYKDNVYHGKGMEIGHHIGEHYTKFYTYVDGNWERNMLNGKVERGNTNFDKTNYRNYYKGDMKNGARHGYGISMEDDGKIYIGHYDNGRYSGNSTIMDIPGKQTKTGTFRDGLIHGKGTDICNHGIYEGNYILNNRDGNGKFTDESGIYVGTFSGSLQNGFGSGIRQGFGKITSHSGRITNGFFHNDKLYNYGTITYEKDHEFRTYAGEFANNVFNGKGVLTYKNGDVYEGEWKNDKKHGNGVKTYADNGAKYIGTWENGERREGKYVFNNGEVLQGKWDLEFNAYWEDTGSSANAKWREQMMQKYNWNNIRKPTVK